MPRSIWRALCALALGGVAALFVLANPARANDDIRDMKARLQKLEEQNAALKSLITGRSTLPVATEGGLTAKDVEKQIKDALKVEADKKKQADEEKKAKDDAKKKEQEEQGYKVGENLTMTAKWKHGLWFEAQDGAFKFHVGGRTQFDIAEVGADNNVSNGRGGIGPYDPATNFRRARLVVDGSFWEVITFMSEFDFLNAFDSEPLTPHASSIATTANTPVPTDLWMTITQLPFIGNLRIGNHKPWIGFEHLTSSRFLNFLERSFQFDAFIEDGNNGFSPGISIFNTWGCDENGMWALGAFKTQRNIFGWNVGDGEWSLVGRATWLPIYQDNGRYLLHLGMGANFRDLDDDVLRLRSRTLIRNGNAVLHNTVAIAQTDGNNQLILNPELVANIGPLTIQAEYTASWLSGVTNIIRTPTQTNVRVTPRSFHTQGVYVEALYFLTGEHRLYNKKVGAFDRVVPNRNYFWVEGEDKCNLFQAGAWQVGLRYSHLDLNNNGINGGQLNDVTAGINWFLNPNFKIQANYSYGHRKVDGNSTGSFQGFGTRFAIDF